MSTHRISVDPIPILARILVERGLHADPVAMAEAVKIAAVMPQAFTLTVTITPSGPAKR